MPLGDSHPACNYKRFSRLLQLRISMMDCVVIDRRQRDCLRRHSLPIRDAGITLVVIPRKARYFTPTFANLQDCILIQHRLKIDYYLPYILKLYVVYFHVNRLKIQTKRSYRDA